MRDESGVYRDDMQEAQLAQTVELARRGDETALAWLFNQYQRRIVRFCLSFAPIGEQDACDLAQETFVRAFAAIGDLQEAASFEAWLYAIARRRCLSWLRGQGKQAAGRAALAHETASLGQESRDSKRQRRLEVQIVTEVIAELPDSSLKRAGQLFYQEGLDARGIAQRLEAPISTVTTWLDRFRAKIRKRLVARILAARTGRA